MLLKRPAANGCVLPPSLIDRQLPRQPKIGTFEFCNTIALAHSPQRVDDALGLLICPRR